jgi:mannan endo-1,4-beta-mannosidase
MRKSVIAGIAIALLATANVFAQAAAPAAAPLAPTPAEVAQQRQQLQQQLQQLQQQLQQLGAGTVSPEVQQQIQQVTQQLALLGGGRGGRGGRGGAAGGGFAGPARAAGPAPYACEPQNPNATPEARALLKTLCDITGKGTLTGQHNFPNVRNLDTNRIFEATGKYPAIWGSDFGFTDGEDKDAITHRDLMIAEAKKQAAAGSIIYLCWHMLRPTEDEPGKPGSSWSGSVQAKLTEDQWQELIASDSPLHQRWEKYMDTAASYLKQLQDAHIAVLWRPMHENNGTFFWWGGHPGPYGTAMLYREVYNRMVNVHHLNNLVWVWNQNGPAPGGEFYSFFPGKKYCDVVSYDNYRTLDDRYYQEILTIADGKPIALGEVGSIPSPEVLKAQPKWTFYMTWAGMSGAPEQAPAQPPTATAQEQRQQLLQQLAQLQQRLQELGTGTPPADLQQQVQRVSMQLAMLGGGGRGGAGGGGRGNPEAARQALKDRYDDPYLIKRGDPLPK